MEKGYNKREYSENNLELIYKAKEGDDKAINMLIERNLPLVSAICKRFINRGYEYDDIYQIGCMGLVKAVNNFNPTFNVKFSTYAVPMIMGEIRRFIRDDGIIKVSRTIKSNVSVLHFAKEELTLKLGREPTIDELSEYSKIDKEEIIVATEASLSMQYLYDSIHQDNGVPVLLIDKISEKSIEDDNLVDKIALKEAINSLEENARKIIILRYFKDRTQSQVAKMLGISQVQVSRIEKRVLSIMKDKLKEI